MNNTEIAVKLRELANMLDGATPATPATPIHQIFADIPVQYRHPDPAPFGGLQGRYDDPLPEATVGSVKMLVTGHVLSMPQPQYGPDGKVVPGGESLVPYVRRVRFQITANSDGSANADKAQQIVNSLGFLMQSSSTLKSFVAANPDTWPFAADEFANRDVYNPVDPAEAAASIKAWADAQQRMREEAAAAGVPVPVVPPTGPVVIEEGSGNAP